MKRIFLIFLGCSVMFSTAPLVSALTKVERGLASRALQELHEAQAQYAEAKTKLSAADERAALAEQNAANARVRADQTDERAASLSKEIDTSHANEQRIANENAKMKPVYDKVTRWFGLGAIFYGVGRLAKSIFILGAVLAVLFVVAMFIFPAVVPLAMRVVHLITSLFRRRK